MVCGLLAHLVYLYSTLTCTIHIYLLYKGTHVYSTYIYLQTITTFTPSVLLVSFFFSYMFITNLSLSLDFVVFLAMVKLKSSIDVMIWSLIVFASPTMFSFGNIALLSSSLTFVPPYLPPLSWNIFQISHIFLL